MHSGNIGEWSELYAFFFLAAQGRVFTANADLEKIGPTNYLDIIRLIREEQPGKRVSYYCKNDEVEIVGLEENVVEAIPSVAFSEAAKIVYGVIKLGNNHGSMEIAEVEDFMETVHINKLKAPSSDKADLVMQIYDALTGSSPETRWSIKSQLGGASSLLNASGATNFIYSVKGLTPSDATAINELSGRKKLLDRTCALVKSSRSFEFDRISSSIFERNLKLIDLKFPEIMAQALLIAFSQGIRSCSEVVAELERTDPLGLGFDMCGLYEFKFKKFLTAVALGMVPATQWDGQDDATGGYLIVSSTGDVVAFHIYNRNEFEDYLLSRTKFETPSLSKHKFGSVVETDGGHEFSLNLQLRFTA